MADEKPKLGDISVTLGNNNKVGNIGHVIQEVPPQIILSEPTTSDHQGGMITEWTLRLTKPVSRLFVQAHGASVKYLGIMRPIVGGVGSTNKVEVSKRGSDGFREESFGQASGTYQVSVITSDKEMPRVGVKIEP